MDRERLKETDKTERQTERVREKRGRKRKGESEGK